MLIRRVYNTDQFSEEPKTYQHDEKKHRKHDFRTPRFRPVSI